MSAWGGGWGVSVWVCVVGVGRCYDSRGLALTGVPDNIFIFLSMFGGLTISNSAPDKRL